MNFKALGWSKALAYLAGGGGVAIFAMGGPKLALLGAAVSAVAKIIDLLIPQPTQTLTPNAVAKDNAGHTTGDNVTTTSTLPIAAPHQ